MLRTNDGSSPTQEQCADEADTDRSREAGERFTDATAMLRVQRNTFTLRPQEKGVADLTDFTAYASKQVFVAAMNRTVRRH